MKRLYFSFFLLLCANAAPGQAAEQTWTSAAQPREYRTGLKRDSTLRAKVGSQSLKKFQVTIPDHFDWREFPPGLTPVKDQGDCGSCWAFATTTVMENVMNFRGVPQLLSEQYLVSCDKKFDGCAGGDIAFDMFMEPGTVSQRQFPYTATDEACKSELKYGAKVIDWAYVDDAAKDIPDASEIAKAIFLYGPVVVAVAADWDFMSYESGVFNTCNATSVDDINHLVALVGYDIPGKYWILRNSWGAEWGEKGYMRIQWGCDLVGNEAAFLSFINPLPTQAARGK